MGCDKVLTAIIMASGFSSRLGTNKLLLPYKGKYLIEHILDTIISSNYFYSILVARDDDVLELGKVRGIQVISNNRAEIGQSESIKLGVENTPFTEGYAFFAADQPLMDGETLKLLVDQFYQDKNFIVVPKFQNHRGTPVIFPKRYKSDLLALSGDIGGRTIIKRYKNQVQFVEVKNENLLLDIDTLRDYQELLNKDDKDEK